MECSNCASLFKMINVLNDSIASILSGYELMTNVIDNHETEISKIKSICYPNELIKPAHSSSIDNIPCCEDQIISSSLTSIAANVDVFSLSNVEIECYNPLSDQLTLNRTIENDPEPPATPKPVITSPVMLDEFSDKSVISGAEDESSIYGSDLSDQSHFPSSNYSSDLSENSDSMSTDESSEWTKQSDPKSTDNQALSSNCETNKVPCIVSNSLGDLPYETHDHQIFNLFEERRLDDSTVYTHFFNNRTAAYYGINPYGYGSFQHKARDFSENPYLQKLLSYVEIAYPTIQFNSAMIHKYQSGEHFIPHHSDDEEAINDDSVILTISLGETRSFQFREKGGSGWNDVIRLNHGDSLVMTKKSQKLFTHSIPRDDSKGMRISITLREIKPKTVCYKKKETSTQTIQPVITCDAPVIAPVIAPVPISTSSDAATEPILPPITSDGYQPVELERQQELREDVSNLQPGPEFPYQTRNREFNGYHERKTEKEIHVDTLYISSSMFRHLDPNRLSSAYQKAQVLFYPGADAQQMGERLTRDPNFIAIEKKRVHKIFVMVGTNNIDRISDNSYTQSKAENDISELLYRLWAVFDNAQIHVINLLPRQNPRKNYIVKSVNQYIRNLCETHGLKFIDTELCNDPLFSYTDGIRKGELFSQGHDNVHLNMSGYSVLAQHLKYLAHLRY